MNILILGGAGYIGSVFVEYLLKNNFKVTVYDSFVYEQNTLAIYCNNENFSIIKKDIRDINYLKKIIKKFDIIIPLASLVGAPLCEFRKEDAKSINLKGQLDLFRIIEKNQLIIMPTTNSAYGSASGEVYCDENTKLNPISDYAKHKVMVENELMQKENAISLRLATVFGMSPRMRIDLLVNDFVFKAIKDRYIVLFESHFKRNYIHVRDVCRAFIHSINNMTSMKSNIYNLGLSDANLSKKELCEEINKYIDFDFTINEFKKDPDQRNYIVSNDKIVSTGFKAKYSLSNGIQELKKGYESINLTHFRNFS